MDQFNLFEPDLELGRSLIPYGDMEIQGVWPRKQRTPSDVFPTNAALIGRGPNNDARWCATDKDGILLTNPGSGGSSSVNKAQIVSLNILDVEVPRNDGGYDFGMGFVDDIKYITTVLLSFVYNTGTPTAMNSVVQLLLTSPSFGDLILANLPISADIHYGNCVVPYNPAILPPTLPTGGHMKIKCCSPGADVIISGAIYISLT